MPLYGDILQANIFDLKNSINRQINGDLEPLKGFGIKFFGSYHPLIYLSEVGSTILFGGALSPECYLFLYVH